MLVVRLPALERTAWRRGLRVARALERRAATAFARAVAPVLRAADVVAHRPGSDVFLAALLTPTRRLAGSADARSALARIVVAMETSTRLDVSGGWTPFDRRADRIGLGPLVTRALARGARERERYEFFSAIGHELRTPLASIRGYLETLIDGDVEAAARARFVRIAHAETLRLTRLVQGMFEISLLDLGGSSQATARGSIAQALDAVRDACTADAAARRVTLDIPQADSLAVAMDTDRLALVLVNLVGNAVKHGYVGGCVRVSVASSGHRLVRLMVDDDGPGIRGRDVERVFAFGERGATAADGTGIGLALVRLMVERAGGRVEVKARPLGGSRFTVTLGIA